MNTKSMEAWVWVLVYIGLITFGVGMAVWRIDDTLGWSIAGAGFALLVLGVGLIWVRSQVNDNQGARP